MRRASRSLIPLVLAPALLLAGCVDRELPTGVAARSAPLPGLQLMPPTTAGELLAWGSNADDQLSGTPSGNDFVAVAGGRVHSVALRADGTLVSWGSDGDGQISNTPSGSGFVGVAAGGFHSIALRSDGSLVSWGNDPDGLVSETPAGGGFVAVAGGGNHSVALRTDGTLVSWGNDEDGQVGETPAGGGFVAVAAGGFHSLAVRADGSLVSWGNNTDGQVSGAPTGGGFVAVAAGGFHSVALHADGSLVSWGLDDSGQVSGTPAGGGFIAVAAGRNHSVALRANGTLVSWGNESSSVVSQTPTGGGFVAVAAGGRHSVAIRVALADDDTPPVITPSISGTLGENGWYTSNVTVSWSVVDEESDISAQTGCEQTTLTSDTDGITLTCEASSAGGTASQSVTIKRDATPPTLNPVVSPDPVLLGGSATATPNASDNLSGVASESCAAVETSTLGSQSLSCTATDRAGNTATVSAHYHVTYAFGGFSAPVSNDEMNLAKAGQTIPLKWRLLDADGQPITTLSSVTPKVENLSCAAGTSSDEGLEYTAGKSGLQNLGDGYYQYNWSTPKSYANSCKTLRLDLGEGITRTLRFQFTR